MGEGVISKQIGGRSEEGKELRPFTMDEGSEKWNEGGNKLLSLNKSDQSIIVCQTYSQLP